MKYQLLFKLLSLICLLSCCIKKTHAQYYIEGQIEQIDKDYVAYLSILDKWDEFTTVDENMFLKSTPVDSLGRFSFEGQELAQEIGFYKIHFVERGTPAVSIFTFPEAKNFCIFLLSNQDSIYVQVKSPVYKLGELSLRSTIPENEDLLKAMEVLDQFYQDIEFAENDTHKKLFETKREEYVVEMTRNSDQGFTNLYGLYVGDLSIDTYFSSFQQVEEQINQTKYRHTFHASLEDYIGVKIYKKVQQENLWLKVIISLLVVLLAALSFYVFKKAPKSINIQANPLEKLTRKESEIIQLLAGDLNNQEIADKLFVSKATVKSHINNIYRKIGVNSRSEVKAFLLQADE